MPSWCDWWWPSWQAYAVKERPNRGGVREGSDYVHASRKHAVLRLLPAVLIVVMMVVGCASKGSVRLRGTTYQRSNLSGTDLCGRNFEGANLIRANLEGTDLRNANLKKADLWNAKLRGANLQAWI